jgi:hypothetical protein
VRHRWTEAYEDKFHAIEAAKQFGFRSGADEVELEVEDEE